MEPTLDCPLCGLPVSASPELAGTAVKCPHCNGQFTVPEAGEAHLPPPPVYSRTHRFTFTCRRCGSALEGHVGLSGRRGRCPTCGAVFIVPQVDPHTGLPTGPAEVADDGQLPTPMHAYAAAGGKAPVIKRLADGSQVIVCPRCDLESAVDADICARCGLPFTMEGASSVALAVPENQNGLATASLIVGIISVPAFCFFVLGPAAVILGILSLTRQNRMRAATRSSTGTAIAGILCGMVSSVCTILYVAK